MKVAGRLAWKLEPSIWDEELAMVFYTGQGYLVFIFFLVPLMVIGGILDKGFGVDVLRANSWWPLHSLMIIGAILTYGMGSLMNRDMVREVTYEKSGPVTTLKPRHTLYGIRMEYWGPITLALYFAFAAYRSFR